MTFDLAEIREIQAHEEELQYFQTLDGNTFEMDEIICWSDLPKELQEF